MKSWVPAFLSLVLMVAPAAAQDKSVYNVNGRIPLGIESFRAQHKGGQFYLIASAENPAFIGLYRAKDRNGRETLFDASKSAVKFYPRRVQFRVTASSRDKLVDDRPFVLQEKIDPSQLFAKLQFRLKVFRGLEYWYIRPSSIENVGVPNSIAYDERIYSVGFDLGKIPIDDRIVMEVLSPNGERLCKFHLDLF